MMRLLRSWNRSRQDGLDNDRNSFVMRFEKRCGKSRNELRQRLIAGNPTPQKTLT